MTKFEERINRLAVEAGEELKAICIHPSDKVIAIKENRRAKKRLGCCKKERRIAQEFFIIEISTVLEEATDQAIKEILIHELLHTCKGCFNHGKLWKLYAAKVNQVYGYNISTYADTAQLNIEKTTTPKYRYEIRCQQCNHVGYRQKKSKVITYPHLYKCGKCAGTLKVRKI